jgi:signal transduction histidine kinase
MPARTTAARPSDAEALAALCVAERSRLRAAGRTLHDQVGPLISAAGLKLQMLREEAPAARGAVTEVLDILEQAVEGVRRVSQELLPAPSPRLGLKAVLEALEVPERVSVHYTATAALPEAAVTALYEAARAAVNAAVASGAARVAVSATGAAAVAIRIADNGRAAGRARALSIPARLARHAGLRMTVVTGKSTIVWIKYAVRSASGR